MGACHLIGKFAKCDLLSDNLGTPCKFWIFNNEFYPYKWYSQVIAQMHYCNVTYRGLIRVLTPLETIYFSIYMPLTLMHHIFTSVWALTPKLNPKCTFSHNHDLNHTHLTSMQLSVFPAQSPSNLPCQKWNPYKVRVTFSKPIHTARTRGWPNPTIY